MDWSLLRRSAARLGQWACKRPDSFRVVAIMMAYNESDIIYQAVKKLYDQGIGVYVIDNWSTDGTDEIVEKLAREGRVAGHERFPAGGPSGYFELRKLLKRVEELSWSIDADWFIHNDADELRASPWIDKNLKEAIYHVDRSGYNAIDHRILTFRPVDDAFKPGEDFEEYFRYYDLKDTVPKLTTWKKGRRPVSLVHSGGHQVSFPGVRTYPYKFILKHYPIRSQAHGEKKITLERKARVSPEERALGWNFHYDKWVGRNYIVKPVDMLFFDRERFYRPVIKR
jgi:glycosyltransferase involved in cell wall biosynthesis